MSDDILIRRDGAIATVVLNRPAKLNALTRAMWRDLGIAIDALSDDDAVRCIVVFTDASTHMATAIPEASGATSDDVIREVLNAKLKLFFFCPEAECYHVLSSIDGVEMDFVGSLTDAREQMKTFSEDMANFKKVMEQLGKSISMTSVAVPL